LIEETLGYLDDGYEACKVRLGTHWAWDGVTTDRFIGLMRDLSSAVDGRMELMVDGNQRRPLHNSNFSSFRVFTFTFYVFSISSGSSLSLHD